MNKYNKPSKRKFTFTNDYNSILEISNYLNYHIKRAISLHKQIIIICIGTDRSTGDCLGPLVGEKLNLLLNNNVYIYGNLEHPVHAKNIQDNINIIYSKFKSPFIIAVDASLGDMNSVGNIIIEEGPLNPGAALNKSLPTVGDISIKGIVNIYSPLDFFILQNTRLFNVMRLANTISRAIYKSIISCYGINQLQNNKI